MKKISPPGPPAPQTLVRALRGHGVSATPQRLAIFQGLCSALDHPSPEALHDRLAGGLPTLSLATVYKTLHLLASLGLAREVSVAGDNARRFDGNVGPHHHLVCERCHRVEDHYDPALDRVPLPRAPEGFRPTRVVVQILGTCSECAARRPPARPASRRLR